MISKIYLPFEYLPTEVISALTLTVLCMLVFLCASRYAIHRWNAPKRTTNLYFLLCAAAVAIPNGLLYALSERSLQGVVFGLLLSFAAYSDICRREVDDYLSVMIMMVSFFNVPVTKVPLMFCSAVLAVLPMLAAALLLRRGAIGGADIKITAACACVLGIEKTMCALMTGLSVAVIVNGIRQKLSETSDKGFPLVPYLAIPYMIAYFL